MKKNIKGFVKNIKITTCIFTILLSLLMFTNCSKSEHDNSETEKEVEETTTNESCTSTCDFDDLLVETSWISGDKYDRDSFEACGVDGEEWMDKYNNGNVKLKCLATDGHRTELKENTGYETSLDNYKEMYFSANYTNIPENGVTIAQIHNRNSNVVRPWIRVYIDDDRYIKIKETETTPNETSSTYSTYTGPKYTSGDAIKITVWTGINNKKEGEFKIITNGITFTKTVSPSSDWSSYSNDYYLKAGVYTEGNDLQATVEYDYFSINH